MSDEVDTTPLAFASLGQLLLEFAKRCDVVTLAFVVSGQGDTFNTITKGGLLVASGLTDELKRTIIKRINEAPQADKTDELKSDDFLGG